MRECLFVPLLGTNRLLIGKDIKELATKTVPLSSRPLESGTVLFSQWSRWSVRSLSLRVETTLHQRTRPKPAIVETLRGLSDVRTKPPLDFFPLLRSISSQAQRQFLKCSEVHQTGYSVEHYRVTSNRPFVAP